MITNDISPLERHPYNSDERFRLPLRTKTLIIGTAPPPRFSLSHLSNRRGLMKDFDADFYYGSKENILWGFLTKAFAEPDFAIPGSEAAKVEDTENMMQKYLAKHDIWMRDVLETYRRKPGRARSASDYHINVSHAETTFLNFESVLKDGPSINKIVFTSVKATEWFFKRMLASPARPENEERYRKLFCTADAARKARTGDKKYTDEFCTAEVHGRILRFFVAPSPSAAAGNSDEHKYGEIYRRILFEES